MEIREAQTERDGEIEKNTRQIVKLTESKIELSERENRPGSARDNNQHIPFLNVPLLKCYSYDLTVLQLLTHGQDKELLSALSNGLTFQYDIAENLITKEVKQKTLPILECPDLQTLLLFIIPLS